MQRKFNTAMETVIATEKHSHILKPYIKCSANHFDRVGNLSPTGQIEFWRNVDSQMNDFNRCKTELTPFSLSKLNQKSR